MRRKDAQLSEEESREILRTAAWGTLATADQDGVPYAIPMNFVFFDEQIYLHSALSGHKLDNILMNPNVCFSVVETARVHPERFSTEYRSVTVFGTARIISGKEEREEALITLLEKYSADYMENAVRYLRKNIDRTAVIAIQITGLSGKHRG